MTAALAPTSDGLRAHLDEPAWAAIVVAAAAHSPAGALAPLAEADDTCADESLIAAAQLALGHAPIVLEVQTGGHGRGLLARVGCDAETVGLAVRALLPTDDGSGPLAVPGVEVGANQTRNVVAELMRLFPAGGGTRIDDAAPVTLPHELSLTLNRALRDDDAALARHISEQAGWPEPPDVLAALARGTSASATMTMRVAGNPTTLVQQWLLCDGGWVLLTVRGPLVTHTPQNRDEVAASLARLLAGAFATIQAADHE